MARNYENELISKCRPNIEARRRGTGGRHATSLTSRAVVSLFLSLGGLHVRVPRKTCRGYPLVDRYVRNATITPPRDYFTGIVLPICVYREREREREARWNCARVGASLANFLLYPSRFGKEGLSPDVNFHFQSSDYDQVILTSFPLGPSDFSLRFQEWKYYRSSARSILINKSRSKFLIIHHLIISSLLSFLFSMKESF